ncbi:hypothetical protein BpHYR1_015524 [Brachionus plicatilis]|uniref:Uncharacterized protein n=1 Tax=Brachionus plicatilis TaxID=10195 RepID=A0A3M7RJB2_BRAPC|nr:hypothetical protein BpHYR1_015524 [Brachionus plicatilis]
MVSRYRDIIESNNSSGASQQTSSTESTPKTNIRSTQSISDTASLGTNASFDFIFVDNRSYILGILNGHFYKFMFISLL